MILDKQNAILDSLSVLSKTGQEKLSRSSNELGHLVKMVDALHPNKVLQRGYSIATINGKSISAEN